MEWKQEVAVTFSSGGFLTSSFIHKLFVPVVFIGFTFHPQRNFYTSVMRQNFFVIFCRLHPAAFKLKTKVCTSILKLLTEQDLKTTEVVLQTLFLTL